jgi:hypothetical protein
MDILALEQAGYRRLADRHGAQNQRAMRDRLVARHANTAGERASTAGGQRASLCHCETVLKTAAVLPRTHARRHPATVEALHSRY